MSAYIETIKEYKTNQKLLKKVYEQDEELFKKIEKFILKECDELWGECSLFDVVEEDDYFAYNVKVTGTITIDKMVIIQKKLEATEVCVVGGDLWIEWHI